ncbi:MAG: hypothetical protein GY946_00405 [bacterium]|nr:hypothetical protein [bacterium]
MMLCSIPPPTHSPPTYSPPTPTRERSWTLLRVVLASLLLMGLPFADETQAQTLGVMGDSLSDEYGEESYGSYAQNWVEQLAAHAGLDLGSLASPGSWGEPRRTQYSHNWARSGADSVSLLFEGQHTGLSAQIAPEGIDYAVLMIGANDFSPGSTAYQMIYMGVWSGTQIDNYVSGVLDNIETALDEVLPTGVNLVLVNVPDYGVTPTVQGFYPSATGRQAVADVIEGLNTDLLAIAQARQLTLVDLFGASTTIFGAHSSPNTYLTIGNVPINLTQEDTSGGGIPTAGFVHDGIHPNTTVQGVIANVLMEGFNVGYGANLTLFGEAEILSHRGIAYGGSDTLPGQIGNWFDWIIDYAPDKPACSDGIDNDLDGTIDFDGGAARNGGIALAAADLSCWSDPWHPRENISLTCGLGAELACLLPVLLWLRQRRNP